jgi:hypothetical protein
MALERFAMILWTRERHDTLAPHLGMIDKLVALGRANVEATLKFCAAVE